MDNIFGVGWVRTGTTTLGKCFEILGYDHQSQDFDLVRDIEAGDLTRNLAIARRQASFEDWPWTVLYKILDECFPGSRFILTSRDSKRWIRSYLNMLRLEGEASEGTNRIRRILSGLPFPDVYPAQLIEQYEQHNRDVREYVSGRPDDLLVVNWEDGDGWSKLCQFLGVDIPNVPFPHANRGDYTSPFRIRLFSGRIRSRR